MAITCCKNCNDRKLGCHSSCKKYIEEKKNTELDKQNIRRERESFLKSYYKSYRMYEDYSGKRALEEKRKNNEKQQINHRNNTNE